MCKYTVYLFSINYSPSCCQFDPEFHPFARWKLGSLWDYPFISPKTLASGKQSINKKQQEQAGAEYKRTTSKTSLVKAVQTFFVLLLLYCGGLAQVSLSHCQHSPYGNSGGSTSTHKANKGRRLTTDPSNSGLSFSSFWTTFLQPRGRDNTPNTSWDFLMNSLKRGSRFKLSSLYEKSSSA